MHKSRRQTMLRIGSVGCLICMMTACFGDPTQVEVRLDVTGELVAPAGRGAEPVRRPISVAGRFDFIETPADDSADVAAIREYRSATAEIVVDGQPTIVALGTDARRLSVARLGTTAVPFLPHGLLTREERDLLDIPCDPLLIDALQPPSVVAVGDTWDVPADVAAGLLAVDTIETGSVEATLDSVSDCVAQVTLAGVVDGAVDGVPTHVVVDGGYTIAAAPDISSDATSLRYRLDSPIAKLTATLRERRQASHVAPGFAVEARVRVTRSAAPGEATSSTVIETSPAGDQAAAHPPRRPAIGRPDRLWYRDPSGRFDLAHDARWRIVEQAAGSVVMRLVDHGALVAQCSITALPQVGVADTPTVEEVKRDISRSLDGQFERFEDASLSTRDDGVTVVRVVSAGTAGDLPFLWVHGVLADEAGRRAGVTFMLEASMAKRFGTADADLLAGLQLTSDGASGAAAREARLPRKTATP
jgi:hypothetical protein